MPDQDLLAKGQALVVRLKQALRDIDLPVVGMQPGSLTDAQRQGTFATANVTLSAEAASSLARRLVGDVKDSRSPAAALGAALRHRRIGGIVTSDDRSDIVGLIQMTEGVVDELIIALGDEPILVHDPV